MASSDPDDRFNTAVNPSRQPAEGGREDVDEARPRRTGREPPPGTAPLAGAGRAATSRWVLPPGAVDVVHHVEESTAIDPLSSALERVARTMVRPQAAKDLLTGAWLGHAAHPLLTDFPLGAWLSTSLLDLFGGRRSRGAATGLLAFGVVMALPTVATGLAEFLSADRRSQRVGVVHAALNTGALTLYTASLTARRRHHGRAVMLGLAGGVVATVSGYLGGHLTVARKVGTRDDRFVSPSA